MSQEKPAPENANNAKKIRNSEDMKKLMEFEQGRFYITLGGEAVVINNRAIFTKIEIDDHCDYLTTQFRTMLEHPQSEEDSEEARVALSTLGVMPYRIH